MSTKLNTTYTPYTPGLTHEDLFPNLGDKEISADVSHLELAREALLARKENGTYTGEIQQALINVENALNQLLHFNQRRATLGIYTLPVPEDHTVFFDRVTSVGKGDVVINFYHDKPQGSNLTHSVRLDDTVVQQELATISALLEYLYPNRPLLEFIEDNDSVMTVGVIVPDEPPTALSRHDINNVTLTLNEFIDYDNIYNDTTKIHFVCLEDDTVDTVDVSDLVDAGTKELPISIKQPLFRNLATYFQNITGRIMFGHYSAPNVVFYFDPACKTHMGAITQKLEAELDRYRTLNQR